MGVWVFLRYVYNAPWGPKVLDLGTLFDIMLINMQLLSRAADNTSLASLQMHSEKDGKGEERDGLLGKTGG